MYHCGERIRRGPPVSGVKSQRLKAATAPPTGLRGRAQPFRLRETERLRYQEAWSKLREVSNNSELCIFPLTVYIVILSAKENAIVASDLHSCLLVSVDLPM